MRACVVFLLFLCVSLSAKVPLSARLLGDEKLPQDKFVSVYFDKRNPKKIVHKELVDSVSLDYDYKSFKGIEPEYLGVYWGGEFNFDKSVDKRISIHTGSTVVKLSIDGKVIYKPRYKKKKEMIYHFKQGKHRIEVEYVSHSFGTKCRVKILDVFNEYKEAEVADMIKKEFKDFEIINVSLLETRDFYNRVFLELEKSKKPLVLLLSSIDGVDFKIVNKFKNNVLAVVLYNANSTVDGDYKTYHVKNKTYDIGHKHNCACLSSHFICQSEFDINKDNEHIKKLFGQDLYGFSRSIRAKTLKVPKMIYDEKLRDEVRASIKKSNEIKRVCNKNKTVDFDNMFK